MKKFLKPLFIVLLFISAIVATVLTLAEKPHPKVVLTGNSDKQPVEIFSHAYQCAKCKMEIADKNFSAQVVDEKGKTWFFDDIGCLGLWLSEQPFKKRAVIWVYTIDTQKWIDGRKAFFCVTETTPMHYGFGAYENQKAGMIELQTVMQRMKAGEHMANPAYAKTLTGGR